MSPYVLYVCVYTLLNFLLVNDHNIVIYLNIFLNSGISFRVDGYVLGTRTDPSSRGSADAVTAFHIFFSLKQG